MTNEQRDEIRQKAREYIIANPPKPITCRNCGKAMGLSVDCPKSEKGHLFLVTTGDSEQAEIDKLAAFAESLLSGGADSASPELISFVEQAQYICESGTPRPCDIDELRRRGKAAFPAGAKKLAGKPTSDNYVAWCRYIRTGDFTRIETCDSDAPGAFKVYRGATPPAASGGQPVPPSRDQVRAWLQSYSSSGPLKCFVCDCIHSGQCPLEEGIVDSHISCLSYFMRAASGGGTPVESSSAEQPVNCKKCECICHKVGLLGFFCCPCSAVEMEKIVTCFGPHKQQPIPPAASIEEHIRIMNPSGSGTPATPSAPDADERLRIISEEKEEFRQDCIALSAQLKAALKEIEREREACAKLADGDKCGRTAEAIRSRASQPGPAQSTGGKTK